MNENFLTYGGGSSPGGSHSNEYASSGTSPGLATTSPQKSPRASSVTTSPASNPKGSNPWNELVCP